MTQNIEVEIRGRLTTEQYQTLINTLKDRGSFVETKHRILLDYSTFLPEEGVRERTRDIRLRVTNGQPEVITKIGKWGGAESRKELSIKTAPGSFDTLVETYGVLGYRKAVLCIRNTEVYTFKNIEFALVEVPGHSYYFEAEKMLAADENIEAAQEEMRGVCSELGLELFDDEGFHAYIEELNRDANEVFDYKDYTEGYFGKRFHLGS